MMNSIEVCFSPKLFDPNSINDKIVVVVDILRATTIITTMIENRAEKIIPVKNLDEALEYKKRGFLVVAERNGRKVDFADFDNSPFSFTQDEIEGKTLIYSTLNGTNTIQIAKNAEQLIIASFLNFTSVVNYLKTQERDLVILCSGWQRNYCIEDSLFAGALANELIKSSNYYTQCDSVIAAIDLWNLAKGNLLNYIKKIFQYKRLKDFGFENIIKYCFQTDISNVIPVLKNNYIVDLKEISYL